MTDKEKEIQELRRERETLIKRIEEVCSYNDDLFNKLVEMRAERDAAVTDLTKTRACSVCVENGMEICRTCNTIANHFKWRGVRRDEY